MIIFYIHGGLANEICNKNEIFFKDFLSSYKKNDKILFIPFAKTDYNLAFNNFKNSIKTYFKFDIKIEIAKEDKTLFIKQINESKFIYISGGTHTLLNEKMIFLKNNKKIFNGKIIIGSSAGTNILSNRFFSNDDQKIDQGLGILNILTMCHFREESIGKGLLENLNIELGLPIYLINEKEYYKIIE